VFGWGRGGGEGGTASASFHLHADTHESTFSPWPLGDDVAMVSLFTSYLNSFDAILGLLKTRHHTTRARTSCKVAE
jgi:hypothetical protein